MKRLIAFLSLVLCSCLIGCDKNVSAENDFGKGELMISFSDTDISSQIENEELNMKLYIDNAEIPVEWENNAAVNELSAEASRNDIVVYMRMYSNNEQVGSLGKSYTSDDKRMTTRNGDIVLYSGNQIVIFYQPNTWAYTKLGRIKLSEKEVTQLLAEGDVKLTIKK